MHVDNLLPTESCVLLQESSQMLRSHGVTLSERVEVTSEVHVMWFPHILDLLDIFFLGDLCVTVSQPRKFTLLWKHSSFLTLIIGFAS